jgi:hypothetical protein
VRHLATIEDLEIDETSKKFQDAENSLT